MSLESQKGRIKEGKAEEVLKEITAENFPSLATDITVCVQEPKHILNRINPKKSIPRHTIIKLQETKGKEKNLESSERETTSYL